MSDITIQMQLPEAQLERIERNGSTTTLRFSKVYLVQEMQGAFEDSLWTQAVDITLDNCEIEGDLPECPCELGGGDFIDNIYTYRNHVTLPIDWRGEVGCRLLVAGRDTACSLQGDRLRSERHGNPVYLKHIRK